MQSNYKDTLRTLSDHLKTSTTRAVNVATLTAFKENNEIIRTQEGIPKIPIYKNVRLTRSTANRPTATLRIYDVAQVNASWFSPLQNSTGVVFLRPVKLGGKVITQVAHAFIPKNLRRVADNKNPFKRVGRERLPIIKLKTSTLYDYYLWSSHSTRLVTLYNQIFPSILQKTIVRRLTSA